MSSHKDATPELFPIGSGEFLRAAEVARRLGISKASVHRLLKGGKLPGFQLGKCWIVHRTSLQRYLQNLTGSADGSHE